MSSTTTHTHKPTHRRTLILVFSALKIVRLYSNTCCALSQSFTMWLMWPVLMLNCLADALLAIAFFRWWFSKPKILFYPVFSIDFRSMNLFSCSAWKCEGLLFCIFNRLLINLSYSFSFPWFPWLGWLLCTHEKMFVDADSCRPCSLDFIN